MSLNLNDNKRPYSPNLGLDEVYDEIQSSVNGLVLKEFILIQSGGDMYTMTAGDGLIDGKKWFQLVEEGQVMVYNSTDGQWQILQDDVLAAYINSTNEYPQSGNWTLIGGGTAMIGINNFNYTTQEAIEATITNIVQLESEVYPVLIEYYVTAVDLPLLPDGDLEILADLTEGNYYLIDKIVAEGRFGTIAYTGGSAFNIKVNGTASTVASIPVTLVTSTFNTLWTNGSLNSSVVYAANKGFSIGMNDYLSDGDGQVKITIYGKVITATNYKIK